MVKMGLPQQQMLLIALKLSNLQQRKRGTSVKKTIKAKRSKKEVISNDVVAGDVI